MKYVLVFLVILILGTAGAGYYVYHQLTTEPPIKTGTLSIGNESIEIELAETPEQQAQGLSYRESLGSDNGMLFVYDNLYLPQFWMYGMNFPLDIIWIRDGEVIGIEENAAAPENPEIPQEFFRPDKAVTAVLEVNAGWVEKNGIVAGDTVTYSVSE